MWDPPWSGLKPESPALVDRFFNTEPQGSLETRVLKLPTLDSKLVSDSQQRHFVIKSVCLLGITPGFSPPILSLHSPHTRDNTARDQAPGFKKE